MENYAVLRDFWRFKKSIFNFKEIATPVYPKYFLASGSLRGAAEWSFWSRPRRGSDE